MIKIKHFAIDGNEANVSNRVGSNVYAFEILKHLEIITQRRRDLHFTILLSSPPISDMPTQRQHWRYRVITPKPLWTQWALPLHLFANRKRYQALLTPSHYAPRFSAVPYINAIMDLAFLDYPEQFKTNDLLQLKNWTAYSVKSARKIIAISEHTKREIVARYGRSADDIEVVYPSITQHQPTSKTKAHVFFKKHKITQPYILYLGTLQPRKNLINLVHAFENFLQSQAFSQVKAHQGTKRTRNNQQQPKLVLAGKIGWLADETLKVIQRSPVNKQIILTGYLPNGLKAELYKNAACSVLVGLYEGFGIPPLESLSYETLPIVSKTSSLPEVVGDAGILVDPTKPEEIAAAFTTVWQLTSKKQAIYRKLAREQAKKFSWQTSAEKVLQILENI